jgi:hypothetical protein
MTIEGKVVWCNPIILLKWSPSFYEIMNFLLERFKWYTYEVFKKTYGPLKWPIFKLRSY